MTRDYKEKFALFTMQKQSQSNPIYSVFIRVNSWLNSKQTQTNKILIMKWLHIIFEKLKK
jgi:hypothetical protein